jgi:hypothetical protein
MDIFNLIQYALHVEKGISRAQLYNYLEQILQLLFVALLTHGDRYASQKNQKVKILMKLVSLTLLVPVPVQHQKGIHLSQEYSEDQGDLAPPL